MIWLVGDPEDLSAAYLGWLATQRGLEVIELREDRLGLDWSIEVRDNGQLRVEHQASALALAACTGAIVRLNPEPAVSPELGIDPDLHVWYVPERRAALQHLLDAVPFPVINRPSRGRANGSKPFQMAWLARSGLAAPAWVVTNDVAAARAFVHAQPHGAVLKAASGLRCHVRRWDATTEASFAGGTSSTVIQAYVPGFDARVHVVGSHTFGTRIDTDDDSVDYRFDTQHARYEPLEVPGAIADLCTRHARAEGAWLAGFDFRVDGEGRWWCLEMNPVPTFLPYEASTGHRIGDAIIDLVTIMPSPFKTSPLAERTTPDPAPPPPASAAAATSWPPPARSLSG